MSPTDLIPFDPGVIPWETDANRWTLCLTAEPEGRVWVEHELIRAVLIADQINPDNPMNIHGMLIAIGHKVADQINRPGFQLTEDGQVRSVQFVSNPVIMCVGRFNSETFVFLPRPELTHT